MTATTTELGIPVWPQVLPVTIKLLFPSVDGQRLERHFHADFTDPIDAYNAACCMWSTESTGYGAIAAVLVDDSTGQQYPVTRMANTCGHFPAAFMSRLIKTATDVLVAAPP